MVTEVVRPYLYKLDDIYDRNRKRFAAHGLMIVYQTIQDYLKYWRELEDEFFVQLEDREVDEIYFFFNEKILEIVRCHIDMYWLIQDYDDLPLYRDGREPLPFWWGPRRREQRRRSMEKEKSEKGVKHGK